MQYQFKYGNSCLSGIVSILEALLLTISVSQVSSWVLLQFHWVAIEAANAHEIVCFYAHW